MNAQRRYKSSSSPSSQFLILVLPILLPVIMCLFLSTGCSEQGSTSSQSEKDDEIQKKNERIKHENAFLDSYNKFHESDALIVIIIKYAGETGKLTGLIDATGTYLQDMETSYSNMVVNSQLLTGDAKIISDQLIVAARQRIDIYRALVSAGEAYDTDGWNTYMEQLNQNSQSVSSLMSQWNVMQASS